MGAAPAWRPRKLWEGAAPLLAESGLYLAAQCCEHLNRAIVVERAALPPWAETVNAVPQPHAGGSFATAAYAHMADPVLVENIRAGAGIDIGGTLIGMHLRPVAVPVRLSLARIGEAGILCARTRPKAHRRQPRRISNRRIGGAALNDGRRDQADGGTRRTGARGNGAGVPRSRARAPGRFFCAPPAKRRIPRPCARRLRWISTCLEKTACRSFVKNTPPAHTAASRCIFIGHLQTNKVRQVVGRACMIESVGSHRLLECVAAEAQKQGIRQDILVEINIGAEASKSGIAPEELPGFWNAPMLCPPCGCAA